MISFKKKMFGYETTSVDAAVKELDDEIFSLRQKLFALEKNQSMIGTAGMESNQYTAVIEELKNLILQRDDEISVLRASLAAAPGDASVSAASAQISELQRIIAEKTDAVIQRDRDINLMRSAAMEKDRAIESMSAELNVLKTPKAIPKSPDMKLIEAVYTKAFEGAKEIARDTKSEVKRLAADIYSELNKSIKDAASVQNDLMVSKQEISLFVTQGLKHFKALEKIISGIPDAEIKTSEYTQLLNESKKKIAKQLDEKVDIFETTLDIDYNGAEQSTLPVFNTPVYTPPAAASPTPFAPPLPPVTPVPPPAASAPSQEFTPPPLAPPAAPAPSQEFTPPPLAPPVTAASTREFTPPPLPPPITTAPAEFEPPPLPVIPASDNEDTVSSKKKKSDKKSDKKTPETEIIDDILDDDDSELGEFDPEIELQNMKNAIRAEILKEKEEQEAKAASAEQPLTEEAPQVAAQQPAAEQAISADDAALANATVKKEEPSVRARVNVQDILKKYSNIGP